MLEFFGEEYKFLIKLGEQNYEGILLYRLFEQVKFLKLFFFFEKYKIKIFEDKKFWEKKKFMNLSTEILLL